MKQNELYGYTYFKYSLDFKNNRARAIQTIPQCKRFIRSGLREIREAEKGHGASNSRGQ